VIVVGVTDDKVDNDENKSVVILAHADADVDMCKRSKEYQ
jgi:hypothetical protein